VRDAIRQRWAVDQFQDQRLNALAIFEPINARDVGMIERSKDLRFASEPRETVRFQGECIGKNFERDLAV